VATEHRPLPKKIASGKRRLSDRAYFLCLTGIGLLALALRVDYVAARWNNPVLPGVDQFWYQNLAALIAKGKGISSPTAWAEKHILVPTALHGPLTSFLLVPFDVVDISGLHEHQLLMAVAGTATVFILGVLAGRLVNRGAGLVTAVVAAFYPGLWGFDAKVMSEPVEQLLVACVLLLSYSFRYHPTTARAIGLGVAVGLCVLTRSELILEVPLLVIPLCIGAFRGRSVRELAGKAALALGATGIILAPWIAYCQTAFHDPEILSTDLGVGLIQDNNPTTYYTGGLGFWYEPASSPTPPGDESQVDHTFQHEAEDYARAHERRLPIVILARVGRLWDLYHPFQTARFTAPRCVAGHVCPRTEDLSETEAWIWSFYGLVPFAVIGAVMVKRRRKILYPLLSLAVVVTVVAIAEAGVLRFRAPFEDAFVVLAGIGLYGFLALIWRTCAAERLGGIRLLPNRRGAHRTSARSSLDRPPTGSRFGV
jgi:hypothetical protein